MAERRSSLRRRGRAAWGVLLVALVWLAASVPAWAQEASGGREAPSFRDVRKHWAEWHILTLQQAGVLDVPEDGRFRPDQPVTRLDFTVWLARALELRPAPPERLRFRDAGQIPEGMRGLVAAAAEAGLVSGYPDGTFRPDRTLTRAELGVLFGRTVIPWGVAAEERYLRLFGDRDRFPAWAKPALAAVKAGIIQGRSAGPGRPPLFAPYEPTTRAEAAVMLLRLLEVRTQLLGLPRPQPQVPARRGPVLAAYYDNRDAAYASLLRFGGHLDWLIYVGHVVQPDGSVTGYHSPRTLGWAAESGRPVLLMYASHDREDNHALLTRPEAQEAAIAHIKATLLERGYAGVHLDLEDIPWEDRPLLTRFVQRLSQELRAAGKLVTMAVPAKTRDDPRHGWSGAFDYAELGRAVDYVVIMTYDQHWPSSPPGPIGSLPWMEAVLRYAVTVIPPDKILIGIPGYAYDWPADGGRARALYSRAAPDLARRYGVEPVYYPELGESRFTYRAEDGRQRVVWYTPPQGVAAKLALVERYGLAGAALWQMGYEPPEFWQVAQQVLRRSPS